MMTVEMFSMESPAFFSIGEFTLKRKPDIVLSMEKSSEIGPWEILISAN